MEDLDGARLERIYRKTLVWHNDTGCDPSLAKLVKEEIGQKGEDLKDHMTPNRWLIWIKAIAVTMFLVGHRYASGVDFPEKDDMTTLKRVTMEEFNELWKQSNPYEGEET